MNQLKDYDLAMNEALCLANYLWEKHFKKDAPNWEPLSDLSGILSQIDNMVAGLEMKAGLR